jgi:RNA polymerase subunit RPABC4/transcription elongation factor Spt4
MTTFVYRLQCPVCDHKQFVKLDSKWKEPEYFFSPTQGVGGRIKCNKCGDEYSATSWTESIYVPKPIFKF